jgi:hypothetical protein
MRDMTVEETFIYETGYKYGVASMKQKVREAIEKARCVMNQDMCHIDDLEKELGL